MNPSTPLSAFATTGSPTAVRLFAAAGVERTAACVFWAWSTEEGRKADADFYFSCLEKLWGQDAPPEGFARQINEWINGVPEFQGEDSPEGILAYAFEGVVNLQVACSATTSADSPETIAQVSGVLLDFAKILDQEENTENPLAPGSFDISKLFEDPKEPSGRHYVSEKEEQARDLESLTPITGDAVPDSETIEQLRTRARELGRQRLEALKAAQAVRKPWDPR